MKKQDVTYSRTAEDLERKYNLGQIAQGGIGGDSGKISQALQELSDCKATISNMLRKINEIESQLGEGGNIVYLAQSEYDDLPDSKLTDGVEYRITDAGIGETQASNVSYDNSNSGLEAINTQMAIDEITESLVYSLNEIKCGTWIDGKPLYRKMINFGVLPNNDIKRVSHNINVDHIHINLGASYWYDNSNTHAYAFTFINYIKSLLVNKTDISITTIADATSYNAYVCVEYTKTTD